MTDATATDPNIEQLAADLRAEHQTTPTNVTANGNADTPLDKLCAELDRLDPERRLGKLIAGVYKNGGRGANYGLILSDGEPIDLGPASRILKPREVQAAILDATGISITVPRLDEWGKIAERIHTAAEIRDVTLSPAEETAEWASHYLRGRIIPRVDVHDAGALYTVIAGDDPEPFTDKQARLYLRLPGLLRHVTIIIGQRTTARDLSERLGLLGFTKRQLSARHAETDHVAKLRTWRSRPNFDPNA